MKRTGLMLAMIIASSSAHASSIYRCEVNGEITFSQQPCAANAEAINLRYSKPDEDSAARAQEDHEQTTSRAASMELERRIRWERDKIQEEERHINSLQRQRSAEIAALQQRQTRANNNLAGATFRQSLAEEMQAVNQRFDAQIDQRQANIDRMRADIERMQQQ
ncbi:MAG: DUF4124 domain-containing protein [Roseovarius sp.]|nr:DUF4124 domain-containing protein [Roseovarius sp.]